MAFTNDSKPSTSWDNDDGNLQDAFLLKEDTAYLLLETGGKIVLERIADYTKPLVPTNSYINDSI